MVEKKPYSEILDSDSIIRKFSQNIDPIELMWHRDLKNRKIDLISGNGWKIQTENQLPVDIKSITINKLEWHRIIKGSDDLIIKIEEFD